MTLLRLVPTNVAATRLAVASNPSHYLGVWHPNSPATVPTLSSNNHNNATVDYVQFIPGTTDRTTTVGSVPSSATGAGWILPFEYTGDTAGTQVGVKAGTYDYSLRLNAGATPSTFTLEFRLFKVTLTNTAQDTSIGSSSLVASWNHTGLAPSAATTYTGTYTISSNVNLGSHEYLILEIWSKMTSDASSDTIQLLGNTELFYINVDVDDSGHMWNRETSRPDSVQWNNKNLIATDRFGNIVAWVNTENNAIIAATNPVSYQSTQQDARVAYWQISTGGSTRNSEFSTTPQTRASTDVAESNPIFQRVETHNVGAANYGSATTCNFNANTWWGKKIWTSSWYLAGASAQSISNLNFRLANKDVNATDASATTAGDGSSAMSASTAGSGVNGYLYSATGANYAWYGVPDRHRGSEGSAMAYNFVNDGTNTVNFNVAFLQDGGSAIASQTSWAARAMLGWESVTGFSINPALNNFNANLNGPPTTGNSRLTIRVGTAKSNDDTAEESILNGFDFERMAYRITASSNEVKSGIAALASYACPFTMWIIESYTGSYAPVVATSSTENGTYTELDSGKTSGNTVVYKGTNYASYVDTTNDIAYVVTFDDVASNTTKWFKIKDALSTAHTKSLPETVTATASIVKKVTKPLAEAATVAASIANKAAKIFSETISSAGTIKNKAGKAIGEGIALSDSYAKAVAKALSEAISLASGIAKRAVKKIADGVSVASSFSSLLLLGVIISNGISVADSIVKKFGKVINEAIGVTESRVMRVAKALAVTVSLTDTMVRRTIKRLSEAVALADVLIKVISKKLQESVTLGSTLAKKLGKVLNEAVHLAASIATIFIVTINLITKANARQLATATVTTLNKVLGYVAQQFGTFAHVLRNAPKSLTTKMSGNQLAAKSLTQQTNVVGPVSGGLTVLNSVSTTVYDETRGYASVLTNSTTSVTSIASTSTLAGVDITQVSTAREAVGASLTSLANAVAYTARDLTSAANTSVVVSLALTEGSNVLVPVGEDTIALGHVYGLVGTNLTSLSGTVDNAVGTSLTQLANASELVAKLLTQKTNVSEIIAKYLTQLVGVSALVDKSLTPLSNILTNVSNSLILRAGVYLIAGKALTQLANASQAISKSLTAPNTVLTLVAKDFTALSGVLTKVGNTLTEIANAAQVAMVQLTEIAKSSALVGKDINEATNIREVVARTFISVNNVLLNAAKDLTTLNNIVISRVTIQIPTFFGVRSLVGMDFVTSNSISAPSELEIVLHPFEASYDLEVIQAHELLPVQAEHLVVALE